MVTTEEIIKAAHERGYTTGSRVDPETGSRYTVLQPSGIQLNLFLKDKREPGGLLNVWPGTADQLLNWYEGQIDNCVYDAYIDEYIEDFGDEDADWQNRNR